jgi:hypothetical protein
MAVVFATALPAILGFMRGMKLGVREPTLKFCKRMKPCASAGVHENKVTAAAIRGAAPLRFAIRRLTSESFNEEPPTTPRRKSLRGGGQTDDLFVLQPGHQAGDFLP